MLAHKEMEKLDFSFAQECSNDRGLNVFSHYSSSSFIEEDMTTSDALVAIVNILLQNFFTCYSTLHYFPEIKTTYHMLLL